MSTHFNISVVQSLGDETDAVHRINGWLKQHGFFELAPLVPESDRNMMVEIFSGANRGSAVPDGFTSFLSTLSWEYPQEVVVVIHPDNEMIEAGLRRVEIWRPDRKVETTEASTDAR